MNFTNTTIADFAGFLTEKGVLAPQDSVSVDQYEVLITLRTDDGQTVCQLRWEGARSTIQPLKVGMSASLPTRDWAEHARSYSRAEKVWEVYEEFKAL